MRNDYRNQTISSTTTHSEGMWHSEKTIAYSVLSYGRISDNTGGFKLSYEGEDPIKNYLLASLISTGKYFLCAAAAVAVPLIVTYGLKKMGIIKETAQERPSDNNIGTDNENPMPPIPACEPDEASFWEDVENAIKNGVPVYLISTEIVVGSRIIIFSGPGIGKSIMVVQMAFSIASGNKCGLFPNEVQCEPQQVLLIDTEQEAEDLYIRYANSLSEIPHNITRASNCNFNSPDEVASYIWKKVSVWTSNGTVIVDNITSAFSLQSPEKIRLFYGQLRAIQGEMRNRGVKITYIMLCHETKSSKKLTLKSIQGSGNLGHFATAVYGLERPEEGLVELHVLKNRRSRNEGDAYLEELYETPYFHFEYQGIKDTTKQEGSTPMENVASIRVDNPETKVQQRKCTDEQIEEMRRLYREGRKTINQLHNEYGLNARTVRKYLGLKH